MLSSLFFVIRVGLSWLLAYIAAALILVGLVFGHDGPEPGLVVLAGALLFGFTLVGAFSHVRRVRLIAGEVNLAALANRQRRQIEIPFEAGEAFDLLEAAIGELPGAQAIESARDSLQLRAKVLRLDPYSSASALSAKWGRYFGSASNQLLATVSPHGDSGSVTLICEPDRPAWCDWFLLDHGTNLENAEAIGRALTRRVAARRRGEQASAQQSATEKELAVARLNLLHAQVEPHFLYNTLASAQLLTRSDPACADQMLGNLITYLRHSLPRTEDSSSTLGAELERTRAYLDILKIRMGARLQLNIDVAPALYGLAFPSMMLQTLVENAIKHGLEPKSGGGTVWIIARVDAKAVAVTVADDGRGFSLEGGGTGIGLRNVRERLRLAYGAAASFAIVANFPCGVAATITLPHPGAAPAPASAPTMLAPGPELGGQHA